MHGLSRGPVVRVVEGAGRVFGVAFRPGCLRPFLKAPMSALTGRSVPAADVFGPGVPRAAVAGAPDEEVMRRIAEEFLCSRLPAR
jgi:hypothetical protein